MPLRKVRYPEILQHGSMVAMVEAEPDDVEEWTQYLSKVTKMEFDWQFIRGKPHLMVLAKDDSRYLRAVEQVERHINRLNGELLAIGTTIINRRLVPITGRKKK